MVTGPETISGIHVTRRCYVPDMPGEGWACFMEYFENPTGLSVLLDVTVEATLGSDLGGRVVNTSSGDDVFTAADRWMTSDDGPGGDMHDPALSFNFWGVGGATSPRDARFPAETTNPNEPLTVNYAVDIPPHSSVMLMYFSSQHDNGDHAAALARAQSIDALPAVARTGLNAAPPATMLNWNLSNTLTVTPSDKVITDGYQGGPFVPTSCAYALRNDSGGPIDWSLTGLPAWLAATPMSGVNLAPGASAAITVTLEDSLPLFETPQGHSATIYFEDTTNNTKVTRAWQLNIAGRLDISPADVRICQGRVGGPFSPNSLSYTLVNPGDAAVTWSVAGPAWLSLSPANSGEAGGPLESGQSVIVTATITASANGLPVGAHDGALVFTNETHSSSEIRSVQLVARDIVYVDGAAVGANDGVSWLSAFTSIQDGINAAAGTDAWVWVAEGSYVERLVMASGVEVYGGFPAGGGTMQDRDPQAYLTVVDGANLGTVATFNQISSAGINGFTLRNGFSAGNGGGIFVSACDETIFITDCVIRANKAAHRGSGVYIGNYSRIRVANCWIIGNVHAGPGEFSGGLMCDTYSTPTITDSYICGNTGRFGGGVGCIMSSPTFERCVISGNTASSFNPETGDMSGAGGAGLFAHDNAHPVLNNCLISGNYAVNWGAGALYCQGNSKPRLNNCTISSNRCCHTDGWDGISGIVVNTGSSPTLTNCILERMPNFALFEEDASSSIVARHCLFYNNGGGDSRVNNASGTATYNGGGMINAHVEGCDNNVPGAPSPQFAAGVTGTWAADPVYNPATETTTLTAGDAPFTGMNLKGRLINANTDQRRQALILSNTDSAVEVLTDITTATGFHGYAANGDAFEVMEYRLAAGSPALDGGDNSVVAPSALDLDLGPRIRGDKVDLGVYEATPVLTITRQPIGATRHRGANYTLSVTTAHGTSPIAYVWRKGGSLIEGEASPTLALSDLELSDAGAYNCRITDAAGGDVTSNDAVLTVLDGLPLEIVSHPVGDIKFLDDFHTFSVAAINGIPPLSYRWAQDWTALSGATAADYARGPLVLEHAGDYRCRVMDATSTGWTWFRDYAYRTTPDAMTWQAAADWAVSVGGHLATVVDQEENDFLQTLLGGASGWIGYSNVAMDGNWAWMDGQAQGFENFGDSEPNYWGGLECVAHIRPDGKWNDMPPSALMRGLVKSDAHGVVSNAATLTVIDGRRLAIIQQPSSRRVEQGSACTFRVRTQDGVGIINYQWQHNGEVIFDEATESYTLTSATLDHSGDYDCMVSDDYITLMSSTARLTVVEEQLPLSDMSNLGVLALLLAVLGAYRQRRHARKRSEGGS